MNIRIAALALTTALLALVPVGVGSPTSATTCVPQNPSDVGATPVATTLPVVTAETRIHWTRVTRRVTIGDQGTLQGQVVTADGAVGGAGVHLYVRRSGGWAHVASTTSDNETGVFAFSCLSPNRTTDYRVVHRGDPLYGPSAAERAIGVARRVPSDLRRSGPHSFVVFGSVYPAYDGRVTLERRDCEDCPWEPVRSSSTGARSTWQFRVDLTGLEHPATFRVTVPADRRFVLSVSDHTFSYSPD